MELKKSRFGFFFKKKKKEKKKKKKKNWKIDFSVVAAQSRGLVETRMSEALQDDFSILVLNSIRIRLDGMDVD